MASESGTPRPGLLTLEQLRVAIEIGRASCRERVFNWV